MKQTIDLFEIATKDGDNAKYFYETLFNWQITDIGPMMKISSSNAGIKGHILKKPHGGATHLTIYIRVENIADCLMKVEKMGGKVILPEMPVPSGGSIAKFTDLDGNIVAVFQNKEQEIREISEHVQENQIGFFEIASREGMRSKYFYESIFNWQLTDVGSEINISKEYAGVKGHILNWTSEAPTYLTLYVKVDNIPNYLEKINRLGGKILIPETEIRNGGTFAQFQDLDGNIIGLSSGR